MLSQLDLQHNNNRMLETINRLELMDQNSEKDKDLIQPTEYRAIPPELAFTRRELKGRYALLKEFLLAKKLEGCSASTIRHYHDTMLNFIIAIDKHPAYVTTQDIRLYLMQYQETRGCGSRTLDTMRRVFSSFWNWMEEEDYILKNPVRKIHKIKHEKVVKKAFTDEEIERLRDACKTRRELAIIDFLYSSGVRVSELVGLNIDDLDFNEREGVVFGKGGKERIIYFDAKTKLHVQKYLERRMDDNPALFVTTRAPYRRLEKSGVEMLVREVGERAGVANVHPHRFRRTLATNMIDKGVPIEQVQRMLGHTKIDTTLLYANVNQTTVKLNHTRFIN